MVGDQSLMAIRGRTRLAVKCGGDGSDVIKALWQSEVEHRLVS